MEVHGYPDCWCRPSPILHRVSPTCLSGRFLLSSVCHRYVRLVTSRYLIYQTCLIGRVSNRVEHRTSDVPDSFADAVIMNSPLDHLNDQDALISIKEVVLDSECFPLQSCTVHSYKRCVTHARYGACSRAAALHSSECKIGDRHALFKPAAELQCPLCVKNNKLRMFSKGWQFGREPKWWLEVVEQCLLPLHVVFTALVGCAARLAARCQVLAVW